MIARTMKTIPSIAFLLCSALTLVAQLPTPNADGASAGHHIFRTKDVEAANKFWMALGGEPSALANIKLMKFPGVLLYISAPRGTAPAAAAVSAPAAPIPGNQGTTVEFITFKVKDLKESLAKWKAAGIEPVKKSKGVTLLGPDDVQIRITEDKKLTVPIVSDGVVMNAAN